MWHNTRNRRARTGDLCIVYFSLWENIKRSQGGHMTDKVCDSYVKNALRILLKEPYPKGDKMDAITELYFCIKRAGTGFPKDIAMKLKKYKFEV